MKALLVFGARPNFMKIAPVYRVMRRHERFEPILVHTGQHFDKEMSSDFMEALELPKPDFYLEVGGGSQSWQIAEVMKRLERVIELERPDLTVVVGDVNSTLGAALVSSTLDVPVAHVEAGLRSKDWRMPEERNRVLTDRLSSYLFTPSPDADENLRAEGIEETRIFQVGNVMIDSLEWVRPRLPREQTRRRLEISEHEYGLVTIHRPSNVDEQNVLREILEALKQVAAELPLLFPIHPRTRQRLSEFNLSLSHERIRDLPPLSYPEFVGLLADAAVVLTDSGGIQEEATVLGIPCITLRENTERPITVEFGTNRIVGNDPDNIVRATLEALHRPRPEACRPPLWDGETAERIVSVLASSPAKCTPSRVTSFL